MKRISLSTAVLSLVASVSFLIFSSFSFPDVEPENRAATGGELSFTLRTVTQNGNYAPKHVLAIWIEYNDGFVKTRKAMAVARKQYLYTWKDASNYNVVDAITGPTISSHQTHTVTWDCTDLDGNIVPDGDYVVYAEFTEQHAQGPLYSLTFTKGPDPQFMTPADETYFKDIVLSFTPLLCDFTADLTSICQGEEVVFTDASVNATSWEWNFGQGALPATANTQGPHTIKYTEAGSRNVSLTINESLSEIKEDYISVLDKPAADYVYSGSDMTVNFTNNSIGATAYWWDFGDGNTSTASGPVHIYSLAGTYLVSLIASNANCEDTIVHEVMVPLVGIEEKSRETLARVFPNPNTGSFFVEIRNYQEVDKIRLIDAKGQLLNTLLSNTPDKALISIDLGDVKSGIYFLEIITGNEVIMKRVLIQ